MNLRLHSHEFLSPCQWISDCIPMSSYSPCLWISDCIPWVPIHPVNESQTAFHEFLFPPPVSSCESQNASHEFLFPANESRTAFPWVPIPCQWISDCIPVSSYSTAKFLESFGWVPPTSCHPASNVPIETQKIAFWRDFRGTPIHTTWVPLKSIWERFRCLLRDFRF